MGFIAGDFGVNDPKIQFSDQGFAATQLLRKECIDDDGMSFAVAKTDSGMKNIRISDIFLMPSLPRSAST